MTKKLALSGSALLLICFAIGYSYGDFGLSAVDVQPPQAFSAADLPGTAKISVEKDVQVADIAAAEMVEPQAIEAPTSTNQPDIDYQRLTQQMWKARAAYMKRGDRSETRQFLPELAKAAHAGAASVFLQIVLREYTNFGLDERGLDAVFAPLASNSQPGTHTHALYKAWQNHVKLRTTPFEFAAPTLDGEPFDIARMRGKIVLVEHWNTACSSCIEAMPRIHDLYRKYKPAGFEVVSVVYDYMGNLDRNRVRRIEEGLGLTWTTLAAEGQWDAMSATYGYQGAPQYMLLNRDGTLYAGTGAVDLGRNLERLLKEMLAKEAKGRATAHPALGGATVSREIS